jgi:RNA polymerase sigma factor (TIGR02999 family)
MFRPAQTGIGRSSEKSLVSSRSPNNKVQNPLMAEVELHTLVESAERGDTERRRQLFAVLYDELHRVAQRELRRNASLSLSPTTLLHETFLNICPRDSTPSIDRGQFMVYAARAMRGLLLNYLRDRRAHKRGGEFEITALPTEVPIANAGEVEFEKLNEALDELAKIDARLAECVDLKFFCGFSFADIAQMRSVSERTVQRDWEKARILLHEYLDERAAR